ncbi:hypothetical protein MY4824_002189, partial [Beauveria thailandica]
MPPTLPNPAAPTTPLHPSTAAAAAGGR